ncbi:formate/nitrite transporter family protein [Corynebacterium uropygiale]|uniref:Formate/nitrite transporter family protein n=1 Tax=Corynebacterium uropygiale TaxID=1775911 RepID=A0A9X1QMD9_9CORY|nr:formate/nitrite transporter family protein [Corynebacterium uropygiale]MCF4005919.1 formate/nitrite transporter family protein [Corynebacterium uropygiale]
MSLTEAVAAAVTKKDTLFREDLPRYSVRAILAGAYLTLGTACAGVAGQAVNGLAPGLGPIVFSLLFGLGLFSIIILGAELATGDMMFFSYGAVQKDVSWGRAVGVVVVTTVLNLVGAVIIAAGMGVSAKLGGMDPQHLIATLSEGKLAKTPVQLFVEAMMANFVVNMGIVGAMFAKELVSKFFVIVPIIAIFVMLGLEHVIANFSLMSLTFFAGAELPPHMTLGAVLLNWVLVFLGNFVGGGLLIGGVYAWLNRGPAAYRD